MWLPALAAASIIKVIMAGQRMRQPARAVTVTPRCSRRERTFTPVWRCGNYRPGGAIVRPPYPRVTGAFTGRA